MFIKKKNNKPAMYSILSNPKYGVITSSNKIRI